jgi:Ca2+-binding RTX toxin-like protein
LHGGPGNDRIAGGRGRDRMSGGRENDVQTGGGGADVIFANRGADQSWGGEGADELWALSRYDVAALGDPMGDDLHGEAGPDRFRVRDGEVDRVHCGDGKDRVLADQYDQVDTDCELVKRVPVTSLDQVDDGPENRSEDPSADSDEG